MTTGIYSDIIKRLKGATDSLDAADRLFHQPTEEELAEPSVWEKLFQPFSPRMQAWNRKRRGEVSDTVTAPETVTMPDVTEKPEVEPTLPILPPKGRDISLRGKLTPSPEQSLGDITQNVAELYGVYEKWAAKNKETVQKIPVLGDIQKTVDAFMDSPEGEIAMQATQFVPGMMGFTSTGKNLAKDLLKQAAKAKATGKTIPEAVKSTASAVEKTAIPKAEAGIKPTTPLPEAKPTTTSAEAIKPSAVEDKGAQIWNAFSESISTPRQAVESLTPENRQLALNYGRSQAILPSPRDKQFLKALEQQGVEAPLVKEGATGGVPPVKPPVPPSGIVPPKIPPAIPSSVPSSGGLMGDLQNTDELVTVMNKSDVYRRIANLPGVRKVMSYMNPSGVAKTVPEKGIVARAALREEGANKAIGAFSRLETVGGREKIWGKIDDAGRITQGDLKGLSLDDALTYRGKYASRMTPQQKAYAQAFHELEAEKLQLLRRNGIEINELAFEEGGEYVGRRVVGRINPLTGEIDEAAFIGTSSRPGAKMGAEKARYFKDINEAIEQGFRYLPPDEALFLNIKGAYNRIADVRSSNWVLERIPWRTSASPETLIIARDIAKGKLLTATRLKTLLNRAVRGERVPIDATLAKSLPGETAELRALLPELQKGGPAGDKVQSLTVRLNGIVKANRKDLREASGLLTKAHETAAKTHFGEATVQAPAFAGKVLTGPEARESARVLNKAFSTQYGDIDSIISGVNKVNSIGRYFMLAGDASPMLIQLITFPFRFPKIWGKSAVGFTKALFSPEAQAAYLSANNNIIQKSRNLILSKGGQTEFTEAFRSGGIMQSKWAKAPKAVLEPFQRGFEGALDTAGIELRKAFDHMATTPQRTAEIEQFINVVRGLTSSARLGVSPGMRAAETAAVLAPRYNRAIAALVTDIARGGIRGDQARKALASLIAGGAAITAAVSLARGEGWDGVKDHLDIRDSTKFVTWEVGGQRIGPGSKLRSLVVLLGKMIKEPEKTVDHANNFIRGNFSPALSTGFDVISGKDYIWQPTRPGKGVGVKEGMLGLTRRVIADNLIPVWLQSVALEGGDIADRAIRGASEFLGGRAYPIPESKPATLPSLPSLPSRSKSNFVPAKKPFVPKKKPFTVK